MSWRDVYEAEADMRATIQRQLQQARKGREKAEAGMYFAYLFIIAAVAGLVLMVTFAI